MDITKLDLYDILEIEHDATAEIIKKAYRKKALKCHPDKNPDNAQAAAEWEKISKTLEILSDPKARAAYDKVLKARKAAELRNKALESKRRKIKEELESREAAFKTEQDNVRDISLNLAKEIKRLREEGSATLRREQELLKSELSHPESSPDEETPKLKIKWKAQKGDSTNGGYSSNILRQIFGKYGEVKNLLVSSKRNGSAIIEFSSAHSAEVAVFNEFGLPHNPLQLIWLSGKPPERQHFKLATAPMMDVGGDDFESAVLQKLMQAEESKQKATSSEPPQETEEQAPSAGFWSVAEGRSDEGGSKEGGSEEGKNEEGRSDIERCNKGRSDAEQSNVRLDDR